MEFALPPHAATEVRGPTAFGGGARRFWDLLWLYAVADFKYRYAGSLLGYFWALLRPVALAAVLFVVITKVLVGASNTPHYGLLLLLNLELFMFFAEATGSSTYSLTNGELIRKMPIPHAVQPLAAVLTNTFALIPGVLIVLAFALFSGVEPTWRWCLLPVLLLALIAFTAATALLLSTLFLRFRDVGQIWPIGSRFLFYLTPVLFPIEAVPGGILSAIEVVNPLAPLFAEMRRNIIDPTAPGWFEWADTTLHEALPCVLFVVVCVAGLVVFVRRAPRAAEEV